LRRVKGLCPPSWASVGLPPEKKTQFCAKNNAILSKCWYFFPILQHKNFQRIRESGGLSPSPRSGGNLSPCPPPAPTPMRTAQTHRASATCFKCIRKIVAYFNHFNSGHHFSLAITQFIVGSIAYRLIISFSHL